MVHLDSTSSYGLEKFPLLLWELTFSSLMFPERMHVGEVQFICHSCLPPNLFRLSISLAFHTLPNTLIIRWCDKWSCTRQQLWPSSAVSHVEFLSASCNNWYSPCFWRRATMVLTVLATIWLCTEPLRTYSFNSLSMSLLKLILYYLSFSF